MWHGQNLTVSLHRHFYSHIPCGMWPACGLGGISLKAFLLTHPVWDVTGSGRNVDFIPSYFYSHTPCGMWRNRPIVSLCVHEFLLTHPVWDVTKMMPHRPPDPWISTHTSRVGCDDFPKSTTFLIENFYSHIPCGMWRLSFSLPALF